MTDRGAPGTSEPRTEVPSRFPLATLVLGGLLLLIGIGWLLESLDVAVMDWAVILPGALIVIGIALVLGARRDPHGGLVALGVILTVVLGASTAFDISFTGGIGDRLERPASASSLPQEYRLAIGKMTIDLSELADRLPPGTRTLEASVGMGELVVLVPEDAAISVTGRAGAGELAILGRTWSGLDVEGTFATTAYETEGEGLRLALSVGMGSIKVQEGSS